MSLFTAFRPLCENIERVILKYGNNIDNNNNCNNNNNSIQFFIINVPSLQQNANYRNSTVNICMYISV
jgi:hypothetical protein